MVIRLPMVTSLTKPIKLFVVIRLPMVTSLTKKAAFLRPLSYQKYHPNVSFGHWALTTLPMMRMLSFAAVNAVLNHGTDDLDALFNAAHYWVIIIQGE